VRNATWSILVFSACVLLVTGTLVWLTLQAVDLERKEAEARADATFQEAIRLALWRMESTLAPIVARESSRPYFQYRSFYPATRAYNAMRNDLTPADVVVPSPLLAGPQEPILLHVEEDASGIYSSPQVPGPTYEALAESTYASKYQLELWKQRLSDFAALNHAPASEARLRPPGAPPDAYRSLDASTVTPPSARLETPGVKDAVGPDVAAGVAGEEARGRSKDRDIDLAQVTQSMNEYGARQNSTRTANAPPREFDNFQAKAEAAVSMSDKTVPLKPPTQASSSAVGSALDSNRAEPDLPKQRAVGLSPPDANPGFGQELVEPGSPEGDELRESPARSPRANPDAVVVQGELVARWIHTDSDNPSLVLTRDVTIGASIVHQGVWLDWPSLRASLLASAGDVVPGATLRPVDPTLTDPLTLGRRLAAIPAELVVPDPLPPTVARWSPVRTTLAGAWIIALVAALAIGLVLRASWDLAERRGQFVTAVTHELRTPLTTFCLYSQMLADGMVPDEVRRKEYFTTLRAESHRLSRIVESVLDYARLGRNKPARNSDAIPLGELVDQFVGTLSARCEQSGMTLVVERDPSADALIATDAATVERILYNLVDNACKYAAAAADRRIHLEVRIGSKDVKLAVRDHGPGVETTDRSSIFRAFVRGGRHADGSIAGLGLGLALARGLADQLGGELLLNAAPPDSGAAFTLSLPLVSMAKGSQKSPAPR